MAWESSTDIFGRFDWLTKKTKNLLGRVYTLEQNNFTTTSTTIAPAVSSDEPKSQKVSFTKNDYGDEVDIIIPGVLELTRGNNQGLYNFALESHYNNPGPANTLWSSPFVNPAYTSISPLSDIPNRTFVTWINSLETPEGYNAPSLQVGMPMILKETTTGRIFLIKFKQWTPASNGGGFSYDRWELFQTVSFEKPDYDTGTIDQISDGVSLARNDNGPLYNAVTESNSIVGVSPNNTRWNSGYTDARPGYSGFEDLTNLESRVYTDFTLALNYAVGEHILGTPLIMHDLTTDIYYKFIFTGWTQGGNGGGFVYTRSEISQFKPFKNSSSSTQTAPLDSEGNLIGIDNSTNTVNVAAGDFHSIPDFSGMLIVNDHYDGGVEVWIAGGGNTTVLIDRTPYGPGPGALTIDGGINGYVWKNDSGAIGPFTFTVIKTRPGC